CRGRGRERGGGRITRFMESLLSPSRMDRVHGPRDWSAGPRPGAIAKQPVWLVPGRRPALRLMESLPWPLHMQGDEEQEHTEGREGVHPPFCAAPALEAGRRCHLLLGANV